MAEPLVLTRPLTVADYVSLDVERAERYELQEGSLVMSPSPRPEHVSAMGELFIQLRGAAPTGLRVLQDIDIDLQLAPPEAPGTVRRPDLVVVTDAEYAAARESGALLRAAGVRLAVEILSPGNRRTDTVVKLREYADAGIQYYWVVAIAEGGTVTSYSLHDGRYVASPTLAAPFPVQLDLSALES